MTDEPTPDEPTPDRTASDPTAPTAPRRPTSATGRARRIGGAAVTPGRRPSPHPRPATEDEAVPATVPTADTESDATTAPQVATTQATAPAGATQAGRRIAGARRPRPGTDDVEDQVTPEPARGPRRGAGLLRWTPAAVLALAVAALVVFGLFAPYGGVDAIGRLRSSGSSGVLSASGLDQLLSAAKSEVPTVVSYDYRSLDKDVAAVKTVTTPDFFTQYEQSMNTLIKPQAPKAKTVQGVTIANAAVQSIGSGGQQASVVVYGQTTITNTTTGSTPRNDLLSLVVTMNRVDGHWLVQSLSEVG